ncbi:hypothetical protein B0T22DRAFT_378112 [Podospora appendiculata]|uniref:DUF7730 domain-containing protein n=1 Tax=Podospora appendiculata TaxID=314037 RepID=A0AAE0XA90_9PEZI|nr:hypothetical protein B0T22DRAFT_378112 [Podospora appendiculata]
MESLEHSPFTTSPLEIRLAILASMGFPRAIHVFLRCGKIALSTCVEPSMAENYLTGSERKPGGFLALTSDSELAWARRLQSTWGPHWQCEEMAQKTPGYQQHQPEDNWDSDGAEAIMSLLFVCKKLNMEVIDYLAANVALHVTNFSTLDQLAQSSLISVPLHSPYGLFTAIGPSLMKLDITLRVPLLFLQAVCDNTATSTTSGTKAPRQTSLPKQEWIALWPALALRLRKLRQLHVWLDHDDSRSWSFVNERAVLAPLTGSFSAENIVSLQDVTLTLPNFHPLHENPEIHFTYSSLQISTCVTVNRRMRPTYWFEASFPGEPATRLHIADFPIFVQYGGFEDYGWEDWSPEQIQEMEREMWLTGQLGMHIGVLSCGEPRHYVTFALHPEQLGL